MHEAALRTVLLIRSIDEGDKAGEVLSLAERAEATQAASHAAGTISNGLAGPALPAAAERLLVRRAELLLTRLLARAPVIGQVLDLTGGVAWFGSALLALAFACGVTMSALDGAQRIDVLAFPLLGLIAWNMVVYLMLIVARLRRQRAPNARTSWLSSAYARAVRGRPRRCSLVPLSSMFRWPKRCSALRRSGSRSRGRVCCCERSGCSICVQCCLRSG